jgi:hypothetical protein
MDLVLIASAFLLGLAGIPHCAAMCGPACAAVQGVCGQARQPQYVAPAFHLARVGAYAVAGGLAAMGVGAVGGLSAAAPVLRPLWALAHAAALVLGVWMAWTARQPAWMTLAGSRRMVSALRPQATPGTSSGWQRVAGPVPAAASGLAWVFWPCGLLQSALVVAALANTAWGGSLAMASFALASATGLQALPWWAVHGPRGSTRLQQAAAVWAVRGSGLLLALASGWALTRDIWRPLWDYCFA